jgi:hypothetical protein
LETSQQNWEGEIADSTTDIRLWASGNGDGRYRVLSQPLPDGIPWHEVQTEVVNDDWQVMILGCLNDKDAHNKFSDLRGVTIYTEEPCDYPVIIAETLRYDPLLSIPIPGYVYKLDIQLQQGFNTIAWCIHSPLSYRDGTLTSKLPTLLMPGKPGFSQKTYKLQVDPLSQESTHSRLPKDTPIPYLLGRPGPPLYLSTFFPTAYTPSLVFLSSLADSNLLKKMEEKKYKIPDHFQYHNQLLWVQAQSIINIQPIEEPL